MLGSYKNGNGERGNSTDSKSVCPELCGESDIAGDWPTLGASAQAGNPFPSKEVGSVVTYSR